MNGPSSDKLSAPIVKQEVQPTNQKSSILFNNSMLFMLYWNSCNLVLQILSLN